MPYFIYFKARNPSHDYEILHEAEIKTKMIYFAFIVSILFKPPSPSHDSEISAMS